MREIKKGYRRAHGGVSKKMSSCPGMDGKVNRGGRKKWEKKWGKVKRGGGRRWGVYVWRNNLHIKRVVRL